MAFRAWLAAALVALLVATSQAVVLRQVSMRVLVLGVVPESDPTVGGITTALNARGAPYTYINVRDGYANNEPLPLRDASGRGNYYAIVKMSRQLAYEAAPGFWPTALSDAQWASLDEYQSDFNVRMLCMHSWPFFNGVTYHSGGATGFMQYTLQHQQLDAALAPNARFHLDASYVTPASIDNAPQFEAAAFLYVDETTISANGVAAAIHTADNGVQTWHFFIIPTQYYAGQFASLQLAVNWVVRGVYLGKRRLYLGMQIDDLFLSTGEWETQFAGNDDQSIRKQVRTSASDMALLKQTQEELTAMLPKGSMLRYEWAFNGEGVVLNGGYNSDPLCLQSRVNVDDFWWLSHSYTHPYLDDYTYEQCRQELSENWDAARLIWGNDLPSSVGRHEMVNPAITGLFNADCLRAMADEGIVTAVGDNSRAELLPEDLYHGMYTTVEKNGYAGTFIIPRWATNIFFDNSLPQNNLDHFHDITVYTWSWEELLDYEGRTAAKNLIMNRPDPYMFHQANVVQFPWPGWANNASLMGLWTKSVVEHLNKYNAFPVRSLQQVDMRKELEERMARDACGIDAYQVLEDGTATRIHVTSSGACRLAVSGINSALTMESETYGEQWGGERTVYANLTGSNEVIIDTGLVPKPTCPFVGGKVCGGHGTCDAATNPPMCVCYDGYTGYNCTTEIRQWAGNRVLNPSFADGDATSATSWSPFGSGYTLAGATADTRRIVMTNADGTGQAGAYQFVTLGQAYATPLRIRGKSLATSVAGFKDAHYAVYVDAVYADGSWQYGLSARFDPSVSGWQEAEIMFTPLKPVQYLWVYTMFRYHTGTAEFDEIAVQEAVSFSEDNLSTDGRCGSNSPTNAGCPPETPCCSTYGWCGVGEAHCSYDDPGTSSSSSSSSSSGSVGGAGGEQCTSCGFGTTGACKHVDGWCTGVNELGECPSGTLSCATATAFSSGESDYVVALLTVSGIQPAALSGSLATRFEAAVADALKVPAGNVDIAYVDDAHLGAAASTSAVELVIVAPAGRSGDDVAKAVEAVVASGAVDNALSDHALGVSASLTGDARVVGGTANSSSAPALGVPLMIGAAAVAVALGVALGVVGARRCGGDGSGRGRGGGNRVVRLSDEAVWQNAGAVPTHQHTRLANHSDSGGVVLPAGGAKGTRLVSDSEAEASEYSSAVEGMEVRRVSQRQLLYSSRETERRASAGSSSVAVEEPHLLGTPRSSVVEDRAPMPVVAAGVIVPRRVADV